MSADKLKEVVEEKKQIEQKLKDAEEESAAKDRELAAKDRDLAVKERELAVKERELAAKERELAVKERELTAKDRNSVAKEEEIEALNSIVAAKDTELTDLRNFVNKNFAPQHAPRGVSEVQGRVPSTHENRARSNSRTSAVPSTVDESRLLKSPIQLLDDDVRSQSITHASELDDYADIRNRFLSSTTTGQTRGITPKGRTRQSMLDDQEASPTVAVAGASRTKKLPLRTYSRRERVEQPASPPMGGGDSPLGSRRQSSSRDDEAPKSPLANRQRRGRESSSRDNKAPTLPPAKRRRFSNEADIGQYLSRVFVLIL